MKTNPQSGYVLMVILLVFIIGGSLFLYGALTKSPQMLKHDQTYRQIYVLEELKQRLLTFAWDPELFCSDSDEYHGYLPKPIANKIPNNIAGLQDFSHFPIEYILLKNEHEVDGCASFNSLDNNACSTVLDSSERLAKLLWTNGSENKELFIYRYEICGAPST